MVSAISAGGDAMTPNGRRAWRKWAKKQRYKTNRGLRRSGAEFRNDATGAWYRGQRAFFEGRPSVAVKPFTARSLVGMTMGARKRRARKVAQARGLKPYMLHEEYRIGQRLRPCPGCSLCKGVGCYACYPKFDQDCDACVNGMNCLCDGSGVLPAKRSTP